MTPKKRKRLRWVVERIGSTCGKYCIVHSAYGWCATPLNFEGCPFLFKSFKTKRQAIEACERHHREKGKK